MDSGKEAEKKSNDGIFSMCHDPDEIVGKSYYFEARNENQLLIRAPFSSVIHFPN